MNYLQVPKSPSYIGNDAYSHKAEYGRFQTPLGLLPGNHTIDIFLKIIVLNQKLCEISTNNIFIGISNDEPLVRDFLHQFFKSSDNIKPFQHYINDNYLNRCLAEVKLTNGDTSSKWQEILGDTTALHSRVDIEFAQTNNSVFGVKDEVVLKLFVKNVPKLIVKVFEIHARNYYQDKQAELPSNINLDGLVANYEEEHQYTEPPIKRVLREFKFPRFDFN
jgi:hypothetical protein